jgi:hypothetical protein
VHINPGLGLEKKFYEILITAYYDKSLPMVPGFCPSGFRAGVSKISPAS